MVKKLGIGLKRGGFSIFILSRGDGEIPYGMDSSLRMFFGGMFLMAIISHAQRYDFRSLCHLTLLLHCSSYCFNWCWFPAVKAEVALSEEQRYNPFLPDDYLLNDGIPPPSSSRITKLLPQDVCIITDHEPIPKFTCASLFADVERYVRTVRNKSDKGTMENFVNDAYSLWHRWSTLYNKLIPCLNREYACRHGYNFFMPSSPWLTIRQHGVRSVQGADGHRMVPTNSKRELEILKDTEEACVKMGAVISKGDAHVHTKTQRSMTWCKIALMGMITRSISRCKVLVFLDGDLLLLPENNRTYTYHSESIEKVLDQRFDKNRCVHLIFAS